MLKKTMLVFCLTMSHAFQASENSLWLDYQEIKTQCAEICEEWSKFEQDLEACKNQLSGVQICQLYHLATIRPRHLHNDECVIELFFERTAPMDETSISLLEGTLSGYREDVQQLPETLAVLKSRLATFVSSHS